MLAVGLLAGRQVGKKGTANPPGAPGATSSYTLEAIYNRLVSGADGTQAAFAEPTVAAGTATMFTLDQIMGEAPKKDNTNGATAADVAAGKEFWGLNVTAGDWGRRTGTAALATGNAVAGDVLYDKTFSNASGAATGTMPDNEGDNASTAQGRSSGVNYFTAPRGYYDSDDRVSATDAEVRALDPDITAENVKSGVDIFGVTGSCPGIICTGNATTEDVLYPKTFSNSSSTGLTGELHGGCTCTGTMNGTRWCDNGDGTVTDMTTCLVWLKDADWGGEKKWEDCTSHDDAHTRAGLLYAGATGAGLSDGSEMGDWRLPTKSELYGLTHGTEEVRSTTQRAFTGVQASFYWSSATRADSPDRAWYVYLLDGYVHYRSKHYYYYVWPVRGP